MLTVFDLLAAYAIGGLIGGVRDLLAEAPRDVDWEDATNEPHRPDDWTAETN